MKTIYILLKKKIIQAIGVWILIPISIGIIGLSCGCESFVETESPKNELVTASVFENEASAVSVVTGIYSRMMGSIGFASGHYQSVTIQGGLYADELDRYRATSAFYENALTADESAVNSRWWQEPYQYIYTCNVILEKLNLSENISDVVKKQLEGEAKFIRAFCYFYLVNTFGDVPLHLNSDYLENSDKERSPVNDVYNQITSDLKDAHNLLPEDYILSNYEKTRPNKYVASALLARVYLYLEDWHQAEVFASEVINNTTLYALEPDLSKVFLKNSHEAIWQLAPVNPHLNTKEGFRFILTSAPPRTQALTENLVNAFNDTDQRLVNWIKSVTDGENIWYYPYKYKIRAADEVTEYSMVMRLAEQYLIRAEASTQNEDFLGAQMDLNKIRNRAGLDDTLVSSKEELLTAIYKERRLELFTEWAHRWFDLKRTGRANVVLGNAKPNWDDNDNLFPIPTEELLRNSKMTQNPGY
ncbi:RagB/SusD family nutrient uptake outer membrane protein [Zhouia spongiae]|uniref:RagB/SusD family nutrient uptake outer membrane protein n=1 Tax=Zhouia spongiae TaxID=2202721 RepID=A0ABY3YL73_9FLAO|nr:RagB/SusD family nutrient uptake outer membrane protein [Zhouia spongiae]UNY98349.1 RagB/SusD family nutrient uptake outer membrane protein [Zhouia spongiae]